MDVWEERTEFIIDYSEFSKAEMEILRAIQTWMFRCDISDNILVVPIDKHNWDEIQAEFVMKVRIHESNGTATFDFRKTQGYYAEFLLRGLKRSRGNEFAFCLVYILLRELLVLSEGCAYIAYKKAIEIYEALEKYIESKMDLVCWGRSGFKDKGLPEHYGIELWYNAVLQEGDDIIRRICSLCKIYWKAFFSEYGLLEYRLSEYTEFTYPWKKDKYSHEWPGYIVQNNNICICTGLKMGQPVYTPVAYKILEKKYGRDFTENVIGVYLDGNTLNVDEENIVLFRNINDVKRFKIGKCSYGIDENNVYYAKQEITRDEYKRMYSYFPYSELSKIYGLSEKKLKVMANEFGLPGKKEMNKLTGKEREML